MPPLSSLSPSDWGRIASLLERWELSEAKALAEAKTIADAGMPRAEVDAAAPSHAPTTQSNRFIRRGKRLLGEA